MKTMALFLVGLEGAWGLVSAGDQHPLTITGGRLIGAVEAVAVTAGGRGGEAVVWR